MRAAFLMLGATAGLLSLAKPLEPYSWGHMLSQRCSWHGARYMDFIGRENPDSGAYAAELRCWERHGAHAMGPIPKINIWLARFPSSAQVAEWEKNP